MNNMVMKENPDEEYARKKKKQIKKNNGYCPQMPHTAEWKCPCDSFKNKTTPGYCGEALYYWDNEE